MLKLVSVNIERDFHLEKIVQLIERENPQVLCLQELLEKDIPVFEQICGSLVGYAPMAIFPAHLNVCGVDEVMGLQYFLKYPLRIRG